jgi:hypothetical protein
MSPILKGIVASGISGHLTPAYAGPYGAYDSLATVTVPTGGVSSVSFEGIPSGYKHLQVRAIHLYSGSGANLKLTYNGGTGNNISHYLYGDRSSATGSYNATDPIISFQAGTTTTNFATGIYDFLDYSSSTKNKVLRALVGMDNNSTAGFTGLISALSTDTTPVTSITFSYFGGATIQQYSQFALYGVK